jgi:hypothetical protein
VYESVSISPWANRQRLVVNGGWGFEFDVGRLFDLFFPSLFLFLSYREQFADALWQTMMQRNETRHDMLGDHYATCRGYYLGLGRQR